MPFILLGLICILQLLFRVFIELMKATVPRASCSWNHGAYLHDVVIFPELELVWVRRIQDIDSHAYSVKELFDSVLIFLDRASLPLAYA